MSNLTMILGLFLMLLLGFQPEVHAVGGTWHDGGNFLDRSTEEQKQLDIERAKAREQFDKDYSARLARQKEEENERLRRSKGQFFCTKKTKFDEIEAFLRDFCNPAHAFTAVPLAKEIGSWSNHLTIDRFGICCVLQ